MEPGAGSQSLFRKLVILKNTINNAKVHHRLINRIFSVGDLLTLHDYLHELTFKTNIFSFNCLPFLEIRAPSKLWRCHCHHPRRCNV